MAEAACTLETDARSRRVAEIKALLAKDAATIDRRNDGVDVRFANDPTVRAAVEQLIAAETQCCSFLSFNLMHEAGQLRLAIRSPASFVPALHQVFARD